MADGEDKAASFRFNMEMSVLGNRSHELLCLEPIFRNFWIFVTFLDLDKRLFIDLYKKFRQNLAIPRLSHNISEK